MPKMVVMVPRMTLSIRGMMHRIRLPFLFLVGFLACMVAVGAGLYAWLDGVKAVEARRIHSDLANGAGRIQSEIALEFAVIAALLSYDMYGKDYDEWSVKHLTGLYEKWSYGTRFPGLIDSAYLVDFSASATAVSRYSVPDQEVTVDMEDVPDLIADLTAQKSETGLYRIVSHSNGILLILPLEKEQSGGEKKVEWRQVPAGYIVVEFDTKYFAEKVVERLFDLYLGARGDFRFALIAEDTGKVLASSGGIVSDIADEKVKLTAWIGAESSLLTDVLSAAGEVGGALSQKGLSAPFRDLFIRQWFGLSLAKAEDSRRRVLSEDRTREAPSSGGFMLNIWHSAGSIEEAVRGTRNRRLAIGYSVLASLALVAIVYFLLYRRARELRDREHEFVATVTHELRTPISGISAVADNLAAGIVKDPAQVREYGKAVLDHGRRLKDLIDRVLLYAGLSGSTNRGAGESIDLDEFIRAAAWRVPSLPKKRLIIHISENQYRGDVLAIETILTNLLSNAARHAGDRATVTLDVHSESRKHRSWLVIRVSDTGPGIPRQEQKKVLEPFYRGEAARATQVPGSGLGLSLVNRIVKTFKGRISVNSIPGQGTTVIVRLPYIQDRLNER